MEKCQDPVRRKPWMLWGYLRLSHTLLFLDALSFIFRLGILHLVPGARAISTKQLLSLPTLARGLGLTARTGAVQSCDLAQTAVKQAVSLPFSPSWAAGIGVWAWAEQHLQGPMQIPSPLQAALYFQAAGRSVCWVFPLGFPCPWLMALAGLKPVCSSNLFAMAGGGPCLTGDDLTEPGQIRR